jgi:sterol desaturase/sphingolipid hydroxylase (fatty acid hydroxylase superfamily)
VKHHHVLHHYHDPEKGYGVSSPLWDYVFRTVDPTEVPQKKAVTES